MNGWNLDAQNLFSVDVVIVGMSRAITVNSVTANTAHGVVDGNCAAWGRRIPDVMQDVERWTAELEKSGAFEFESGEMKIRVRLST